MNETAQIGHNRPPSPIDEALAPFDDVIIEAQNWLDGQKVETEAQMKAVDAILKGIKDARKAVMIAEESAAKPIYDQWKAEKAKFAPTITDLDLQVKGLVALVDDFKKALAAEKARIAKEAWDKADAERRAAEALAAQADVSDIDAQREAKMALEAAALARAQASAASKDTVKGMRTVTKYEITDYKALLHWIAKNAKDDMVAFIEEWARKNHKENQSADGLRVWQEKESF